MEGINEFTAWLFDGLAIEHLRLLALCMGLWIIFR